MTRRDDSGTGVRGLGLIRQTAYVVEDIEKAAFEWASVHGVGPFFLYEVDIASTYRGEPTPLRGRMGLAQSGAQQVELIQPDLTVPSLYTERLDRSGAGLHHVCYWTDIDRAVDHFVASGSELVQHGTTGDGNRFAYVSAPGGAAARGSVPYIEFVDPTGAMAALFGRVAQGAKDWDGSEPIRFL
jgi:hypothetical protein